MEDYKHAKYHINGWLKLQENASRFEEQAKDTCFFYEIAWEKLFSPNAEWVFVFLMITLFIPYFYLDRDVNLYGIGESYFNYRKVERYRLYYAMIFVVLLQIVWLVSELIVILSVSSLPDGMSSVCSLAICKDVRDSVSLNQFYVLRNFMVLCKRITDVLLVYFMAGKIKNKMQTTVILLVYLLVTNLYWIELLKWLLK